MRGWRYLAGPFCFAIYASSGESYFVPELCLLFRLSINSENNDA